MVVLEGVTVRVSWGGGTDIKSNLLSTVYTGYITTLKKNWLSINIEARHLYNPTSSAVPGLKMCDLMYILLSLLLVG